MRRVIRSIRFDLEHGIGWHYAQALLGALCLAAAVVLAVRG